MPSPRQSRKVACEPPETPDRWHRMPTRVQRRNLDRLRDIIAALQARGLRITLEGVANLGLIYARRHLEGRYNDGERFPVRLGPLPAGRRGKNDGKPRAVPMTRKQRIARGIEIARIVPQAALREEARIEAKMLLLAEINPVLAEHEEPEDTYPLGEEAPMRWTPALTAPREPAWVHPIISDLAERGAKHLRLELVADLL